MTSGSKQAKVSFPYIDEMLEYWDAKAPEHVTGYSCFDESPDRGSVFLREPDPLVVGKTPH
jgi:hypothetical protein